MVQSLLELWADALNVPLRNIFCTELRGSLDRLAVGLLPVGGGPPGYTNPIMAPFLIPPGCTPVPLRERPNVVGGQCIDVLYTVNCQMTWENGQVRSWSFTNVPGPVTGVGEFWVRDFFGRLNAGGLINAPRSTQPGGEFRFGPIVRDDSGNFVPFDDNAAARNRITGIIRQDGLPDNCGNGPPQGPPSVPPGDYTYTNRPVNITLPGFGSLTIPVTFNIRPMVNIPIQGGIHVPVTVTVPVGPLFPAGGSFPVFFNLFRMAINGAISFIPQLDVTPQIDFPGGGVELPFVERTIGVNVQSALADGSPVTVINGTNGAPNLYVPRLAVVRFTSPLVSGNRQSVDIDVKSLNQFVPVPWFYGADSFTVLPNVGVTVTTSVVRARVADLVRPV